MASIPRTEIGTPQKYNSEGLTFDRPNTWIKAEDGDEFLLQGAAHNSEVVEDENHTKVIRDLLTIATAVGKKVKARFVKDNADQKMLCAWVTILDENP